MNLMQWLEEVAGGIGGVAPYAIGAAAGAVTVTAVVLIVLFTRRKNEKHRTWSELTAYVAEGTVTSEFAKNLAAMRMPEFRKREVAGLVADGALQEAAALAMVRVEAEWEDPSERAPARQQIDRGVKQLREVAKANQMTTIAIAPLDHADTRDLADKLGGVRAKAAARAEEMLFVFLQQQLSIAGVALRRSAWPGVKVDEPSWAVLDVKILNFWAAETRVDKIRLALQRADGASVWSDCWDFDFIPFGDEPFLR
jgi:hypothetical protein